MSTIKENKAFKVLRIIKNVLLWCTIIFLVAVLAMTMYSRFTGNAPSIFGFSFYRVSSGSMQPELQVGDIILVQSCDGASVQKDDIVTYKAVSGDAAGKMVTHRVVTAPYEKDGQVYLVTKGDANPIDDGQIKAEQIEGKMLSKILFLRYLFDFFATPWGLLTIIALIILAFFNEILTFAKALLGIDSTKHSEKDIQEIIAKYENENRSAAASGSGANAEESDTNAEASKADGSEE